MGHKNFGKVYLIGCGPSVADLLTLRAIKVLKKADVVLYDRLIDHKTLGYAKRAKKLPCGKRPGEALKQKWINRMLYSDAKKGNIVVRLKNGDPMIFGRGGEELQFLQERGIEVEVVPGLSSATSVPSLTKIPLTQRGISSSLSILTGHKVKGEKQRWRCLGDTVIVLMAAENIDTVVKQLICAGKTSSAPCALISEGTTENERFVVSTVDKIAALTKRLGMRAPAVLVVGEVVDSLLNFKGKRVTTFKVHEEVKRTTRLIKRVGGIPNVFEICRVTPAGRELKRASSKKWDTLAFMSASGARSAAKFFNLKKYRLVAVGGTTKRELRRRVHQRVHIPKTQNLDGVNELLRGKKWGRILAFRSPLASEKIEDAVNIVAYRVKPKSLSFTVRKYLKIKSDFTLLTSSGLLRHLLGTASKLGFRREFVRKMNESFVISLGETITEYALKNGVWVNYEPPKPILDSLFRNRI